MLGEREMSLESEQLNAKKKKHKPKQQQKKKHHINEAILFRAQRNGHWVRSMRDLIRSQIHTLVGKLAAVTGFLPTDVINAGPQPGTRSHVFIKLNSNFNYRD